MIVYAADKKQFLHQSDYDDIEQVILSRYRATTGRGVNGLGQVQAEVALVWT